MTEVDNRRTFCDHCSLRTDLPGFIGADHADGNIAMIKDGEYFVCHMIKDPYNPRPNQMCLGAALVGHAELANPPAENLPEVYPDFESYRAAQVAGRITVEQLRQGDPWLDANNKLWYGWWAQATAGNWRYLVCDEAGIDTDSVYLFFDQFEEMFGPLRKAL